MKISYILFSLVVLLTSCGYAYVIQKTEKKKERDFNKTIDSNIDNSKEKEDSKK